MAEPIRIRAIVADLPIEWRQRAAELRQYAAEPLARAWEAAAEELDARLRAGAGDTVTLEEAAILSGYSADHLGRMIRQGQLENVGRKHAPRIRRGDLPHKAKRRAHLPSSHTGSSLAHTITREAIVSKVTTARRGTWDDIESTGR